ncbi:MAG: MarR family transcriptional regulator [Cellulophaga sp.]
MINLKYKEDLKNVHALAYFNLIKTSSWIEVIIKSTLKPYDLSHAQLNILSILVKNHPNAITANKIKEGIIVSNPDVTRLLDKLVKKEFVKRQTCLDNRRQIDILITEKGINFFNEVQTATKMALQGYYSDKITSEEAKTLYKILNKIRK